LQTAELIELIRQLPTGYQTIFNLVAIEGFNHIEVASILGISENTSRSQYSRARAMFIRDIEVMEQLKTSSRCS
jgi:RNA polymerase sigma-70 factor (ECF subfamily)